jgi:hypothetical protein
VENRVLPALLVTCFHFSFLLGLFFDTEDGGNMFLRKVGCFQRTTLRHFPEDRNLRNHHWKIVVLWDATLCCLGSDDRSFEGTLCFRIQGRRRTVMITVAGVTTSNLACPHCTFSENWHYPFTSNDNTDTGDNNIKSAIMSDRKGNGKKWEGLYFAFAAPAHVLLAS